MFEINVQAIQHFRGVDIFVLFFHISSTTLEFKIIFKLFTVMNSTLNLCLRVKVRTSITHRSVRDAS